MTTIFTKISRTIFFIVVVTAFLVGITKFNHGSRVVSAENPLASDFLYYLQESGKLVALNSREVMLFAEELKGARISERVLYLSSEAAVNINKKVLGSIYEAGILIVAIDTPISVLYEAVDTVSLGKNAPMESARKDLEDLTAPHDKLVVVSMIYLYNYMQHVNGYLHTTDFYAYPENVVFAAQGIVDSAEAEFNSIDPDSVEPSEESGSTEMLWECNANASITWTNGSNPGTQPTGKAKCPSGFKPFLLHAVGTMFHDCGGWHQVGSMDKWNPSPYSVSEVSGTMTGFPPNPGGSNGCGPLGGHKSPLSGTAYVTAEARDYSPSALQSHSTQSSKTVYYSY